MQGDLLYIYRWKRRVEFDIGIFCYSNGFQFGGVKGTGEIDFAFEIFQDIIFRNYLFAAPCLYLLIDGDMGKYFLKSFIIKMSALEKK